MYKINFIFILFRNKYWYKLRLNVIKYSIYEILFIRNFILYDDFIIMLNKKKRFLDVFL